MSATAACQAFNGQYFCTLPQGHSGPHVATVGPAGGHSPEIARWPQGAAQAPRRPAVRAKAVGFSGEVLPMSSDQVQAHMDNLIEDPASRVLLAVFVRGEELAVQVMGRPSKQLLEALESAVDGYRKALAAVLSENN